MAEFNRFSACVLNRIAAYNLHDLHCYEHFDTRAQLTTHRATSCVRPKISWPDTRDAVKNAFSDYGSNQEGYPLHKVVDHLIPRRRDLRKRAVRKTAPRLLASFNPNHPTEQQNI